MLPASVYSFSRSKYNSATWSSSSTAILVSWLVEETIISFDIRKLLGQAPFTGGQRECPGKRERRDQRGDRKEEGKAAGSSNKYARSGIHPARARRSGLVPPGWKA